MQQPDGLIRTFSRSMMAKLCAALMLAILGTANPANGESFFLYTTNLPPFNTESDTGQVSGISVDVLVEIMAMAGRSVHPEAITIFPLARALKITEEEQGSILFSMARTPERESLFKWVGPIYNLKLGLVSKKARHIVIKDPKDLAGYRIAVIRESAPQSILNTQFGVPLESMQLVTTNNQQFKMLATDRVDLITQSNTGAPQLMYGIGIDPEAYEMSFVMMDLDLYYCLNKGFGDEFVDRLQQELDALKKPGPDGVSRFDQILIKHLVHGVIPVREE